ncbi:MAG: hypothetical protein HUU49_04410 [Candidatus Buchananbacteria bacterium]|nr:hypothetical protein [Candidatus Buchananbacteria bacterium]
MSNLDCQCLAIGSWQVASLPRIFELPAWAVSACHDWVTKWERHFTPEETFVSQAFNTHSMLVKVDLGHVDESTRRVSIFGVDDAPDGLGVACRVNQDFATKLQDVLASWPRVRSLVLDKASDDHVWLGQPLSLLELGSCQDLLLVRSAQNSQALATFASRSITPCANRNLRCWGQAVGLWSPVQTADQLPWKQGFVLKPRQGMSCRDVMIWRKGRYRGSSSRSQIHETLNRQGLMYCQNFIEPMRCPFLCNGKDWLMVLRAFFAFDVTAMKYRYLGGFWLSREENIRLHGSTDAVVGPLQ